MISEKINQGDSLSFRFSCNDYPASSWVATIYMRSALSAYSFDAQADGDEYLFSRTPAQTGGYKPGDYWYVIKVSDGTDTHTVSDGRITIVPDMASQSVDMRSHAERTLEAIDAVIENRATIDQESYSINGRSLTRMSIPDLIVFRDKYASIVARERAASQVSKGLGNRFKMVTRF